MDWEKASENGKIKEVIKQLCLLKKEGLLSGDAISISSKDDMLIIVRESKNVCLRLVINESNEIKKISVDHLMMSSLYHDGMIQKHGFLIEKIIKEDGE